MSIEHPTATDLWSARTAVSITVAQAHRQQADADRAEVERLSAEVVLLTEDRDNWCQLWTELGRGNRALAAEVADLTAERDRLLQQEKAQQPAESDRWAGTPRQLGSIRSASDAEQQIEHLSSELAMSVGIVTQLDIENQRLDAENTQLDAECERLAAERDRARDLAVRAGVFEGTNDLLKELYALTAERDQAIYERDSARAALNG